MSRDARLVNHAAGTQPPGGLAPPTFKRMMKFSTAVSVGNRGRQGGAPAEDFPMLIPVTCENAVFHGNEELSLHYDSRC